MSNPPVAIPLISLILGISTHLGYFIHADIEKHAVLVANCFFFWPVLGLISLAVLGYRDAARSGWMVFVSYESGLFLSIAVYRYFFHAVGGFPGPRMARISALWAVWPAVVQARWYVKVRELHAVYGDVVRIKPREISINDPTAIRDIYGVGTTCVKGPFYDLQYPHRSLQMVRDKGYHSRRRRVWDRGFSSRGLCSFVHCRDLVRLIESKGSQRQEVTELIDGVTFDSMGILAFSKSFNVLHGSLSKMMRRMKSMGRGGAGLVWAPWTIILLRNMVGVRRVTVQWLEWCAQEVEDRKRRSAELDRRDLFSYLIEDTTGTDGDLVRDTELAIGAGSDTTASTLNTLLYLLARHPDKLQRLREEIDSAVSADEELSHGALIGKPYLEGCINESLRLYPAVLSGLQRETGPEGLTTAGVYIPPYTLVSVPTYTIQRDPRNFGEPDEFIPERWSSHPELVIRKEAMIPFSTGTYSCVGRPFAMMEMRLLVSTIVRHFEIEFPPGEGKESLGSLGGTGPQDCFTTHMPRYHLIFTKR
ncbi:cytochrome P450 [Aspergillus sclerotioniger CBS 115572]|uniref:Cytochrome P450 n=1 Tax=Aspergillus sclerotioniger CBS 115572 TaxID=1450535 RepID=A0A317X4R1_9EURO|nr:cytochrome P450 [Aspergillus sclerotioniger CBS 115572]PWY91938.1 cytochrome P450 [Aspergillus sclerotioniger CBS 115572]